MVVDYVAGRSLEIAHAPAGDTGNNETAMSSTRTRVAPFCPEIAATP
ncbi:MAG TPA: hypothetical protein VMT34_18785 [Aggregatilineales bacterium]|nr:hypothetical protein [Aggregatilineales bacterium]